MNRLLIRLLSTVAFVGLVLVPNTTLAVNKDVIKDFKKDFNLQPRFVRSDYLLIPVGYVHRNGQSYGVSLPSRFARLAEQGTTFTIDKIKYEDSYVRILLLSEQETKSELRILDTTEIFELEPKLGQSFLDDVVPYVLTSLFDFRDDPSQSPYTANSQSHIVHLTASNHLPLEASREQFVTLHDAEAQGYRRCPVCFSREPTLYLEGYGPLRRAALEASRLYELAFPPAEDETMQARVREVGEAVVSGFPFTTLGFEYEFKVVESLIPTARSYPTGFIYVTTALIEAIEDPLELVFVIAHEVAHCELHYDEWLDSGHDTYAEAAAASILQRSGEFEADLCAVAYLRQVHPGKDALFIASSVLRKLQFFEQELPGTIAGWRSGHPALAERVELFEPAIFDLQPEGLVFCGKNKMGDVVVSVRTLGSRNWPPSRGEGRFKDARTAYYFLVETTNMFSTDIDLGGGQIRDSDGEKIKLRDVTSYSPIDGGRGGVIMGWRRSGDGKFNSIEELRLDLPDVEEWVICPAG